MDVRNYTIYNPSRTRADEWIESGNRRSDRFWFWSARAQLVGSIAQN